MNINWLNYDLKLFGNINTWWNCADADRLRAVNIFKCWRLEMALKSPCMFQCRDRWEMTLFGGWKFGRNKRSKEIFHPTDVIELFVRLYRLLKSSSTHRGPCTVGFISNFLKWQLLSVLSCWKWKKHFNWSCKVKGQNILMLSYS